MFRQSGFAVGRRLMSNYGMGRREVPNLPEFGDNSADNQREIIDYLIRAGAQAPSWYNCQPWCFEMSVNGFNLILDNSRDQTFYNWGNFNALLACGAAITNIITAAKGRGVPVTVESYPDPERPECLARFQLQSAKRLIVNQDDLTLEKAIWIRQTNTLMFENKPLTVQEHHRLIEAVDGQTKLKLYLFSSAEDKEKLFEAVAWAEQIRFSRRDLHEQLHRMIRWSDKQADLDKTGYTLPSMGVCGFGKTFFRFTRPWWVMQFVNVFGAHRNQARRACEGLRHCSAIGLLTLQSTDPHDLLVAGRSLQMIWLEATRLGLDVQPHNSLAQFLWAWEFGGVGLFSEQEREILQTSLALFRKVFTHQTTSEGHPVFLFRLGTGPEMTGYSLRNQH